MTDLPERLRKASRSAGLGNKSLLDEAADALEAQQWVSVADDVPDLGETVIAYYEGSGNMEVWDYDAEHERAIFMTHWRPIPPPPESN